MKEAEALQEKEFEQGIKHEKEKQLTENAIENIIDFYQKNQSICEKANQYYSETDKNINQYVKYMGAVTKDKFINLLHPTKILVITVNPIEKAVFLHWLFDQHSSPVENYLVESMMYTIFHLNNAQTIIHVNPQRTGENETRLTINKTTKIFEPNYLFLLGICYGLDMKKHSIGSVFVSDSIITFRINFRDARDSDDTIFEAENEYDKSPDSKLIERIQQYLSYRVIYSILSEEAKPTTAKPETGRFLSSNSLVSSRKVKEAVMSQYANTRPKPLGGEMEGAGILKSNLVEENGFTNWIIIKSICDWGEKKNALDADEKKSELIKDSLQAYAMTNTCGAFHDILGII